ncbi:uncharacterized [Tachysurus ichikawai]
MSGDSSGTLALTDEVKLDGRMQLLPLQGQPNEPNESGSHLGSKWYGSDAEPLNDVTEANVARLRSAQPFALS